MGISKKKKTPEKLLNSALVFDKKGEKITGKELRQQAFLQLFPANLFNIAACARATGISRRTAHNWIESDPTFLEKFNDLKETRIDIVESKLFEKASKGDTISCIFFLKTQAKHRGYIENTKADIVIHKPRYEQDQLDAVVRGNDIDREKYNKILGLEPEPDH